MPKPYSKLRPLPSRQGVPSNRLGAKAPKTLDLESKAFELRKKGLSYRQIGLEIGINTSYAYELVQRTIKELNTKLNEDVIHVRTVELTRLDEMLRGLYPGVLVGDAKAIDSALRVAERRAKLLGLDAPTKISGPDNGPINLNVTQNLTDDELDSRIARLQELLTVLPTAAKPALSGGATPDEGDVASPDDGKAQTAGAGGGEGPSGR